MFRPTEVQRRAMMARDCDVLVTAGPGSGKTRVLVGRIECLLSEGASPDDIAAITFTNKAAAEMKTRLRANLIDRWRQARDGDDREEARRWRSLVWGIEGMSIGTIHSFCSSLLRQHPHLAGLDPEFSSLDPYQRRSILDDIIETAVAEMLRSEEGEGSFIEELVDGHSYSGPFVQSYVEILRDLFEAGCRYSLTWEEIGDLTETTVSSLLDQAGGCALHLSADELERVVGACESLLALASEPKIQKTQTYPPLLEQLSGKWPGWREELAEAGDARPVLDQLGALLQKQYCPAMLKPHVGEVHQVRDRVNLRGLLREERAAAGALVRLMSDIFGRYRRIKDEMGALDFDDLQHLVLNMLKRHPQLGAALRRAHPHLLLDEFQDTDGVQWDLVRRLRDLASSGGGGLFLVGDGDQSIYRFRGADVEVFHRARSSLVELGAESLSMTTNFRSSAGLIDIYNRCFSGLFSDYQPLQANPDRDPSPHCPAEILVVQRKKGEDIERVRRSCGDATAHWIEGWIEEGGRPGDVAVLVRKAATLAPAAESLQRRGIPHRIVGGRDFYVSQEVSDLKMLLNWLADERDDLSLAGVLRSPFCGLDDAALLSLTQREGGSLWEKLSEARDCEVFRQAHDLLREWLRLSRFLPTAQLLNTIFCRSCYREALATWPHGDQALANVDKIVAIAAGMQRDHRMSPGDFAGHLTALAEVAAEESRAPVEAEAADVVRVMTIHQAKGLEFPVVILPEAGSARRGSAGTCILNPELGVAARTGATSLEGSLYDRLSGPEKKAALEEEMRIFYVACTRAEEKLVLVTPTRAGEGEPAGDSFAERVGQLNPATNSYLEWFSRHMDPGFDSSVEWRFYPAGEETDQPDPGAGSGTCELVARALSLGEKGLFEPAPIGGQMPERGYSVTALVDYGHCPRLYYLRHVLGWPEVHARAERGRGTIDPLLLGTVVHRVCELMPEMSMDEAVRAAVREYRLSGNDRETVRRIRQLVEPFASSELYAEILSAHRDGRSHSEWSFSCSLPEDSPADGGVGAQLVGKIDQLYQNDDGQWVVVDFKTDMIPAEEVGVRVGMHAFQLNLYRWVAQRLREVEVGAAHIHFLHPKVTCEVPEDSGARPVEEQAAEIVCRIEGAAEEGDFPPRRGPLCRWCGYSFHCEKLSGWGEDEVSVGPEGL